MCTLLNFTPLLIECITRDWFLGRHPSRISTACWQARLE
jgi:hypothetical protein